MNFKYFIILGVLFLISCGGGGSGGSTSNAGSSAAGGTNTGQITDQLQIVE
tara:strand:- start:167 stop:319 length:153 start_codon:yes stop_codon:yes gene_type:complete